MKYPKYFASTESSSFYWRVDDPYQPCKLIYNDGSELNTALFEHNMIESSKLIETTEAELALKFGFVQ